MADDFNIRYIKGRHVCQKATTNKDATTPWMAKFCNELIQN